MEEAKSKVLVFDLEATGLKANFANMLAFGYQWYPDGKPKVISLLDTNEKCKECKRIDTIDDVELTRQAREILSSADMWVTWYGREGRGFDARFLNTRILEARLEPLPPIPHLDLYLTCRDRLLLHSNKLVSVQHFLQTHEEKTPLLERIWAKAKMGDVQSLKYINQHCKQDVATLAEVYTLMRPLVKNHPRVGKWGMCEKCGGRMRIREGRVLRPQMAKGIRTQCVECGGWQFMPAGRWEKAQNG